MIETVLEAFPSPAGWLSNKKIFALFFIRDPKSQISLPAVMTQLWCCMIEGVPTKLKNSRRIDLENASELWMELIKNKWQLVEHPINKEAA